MRTGKSEPDYDQKCGFYPLKLQQIQNLHKKIFKKGKNAKTEKSEFEYLNRTLKTARDFVALQSVFVQSKIAIIFIEQCKRVSDVEKDYRPIDMFVYFQKNALDDTHSVIE